jgi:membrane protein DedA with SNARE-associated domain
VLESFATWVKHIVAELGYPGVFLLITLESTLVPIPSELVMPFAGFMAARGDFSLPVLLLINSTAALLGSGLCYWIGAKGGKPFLERYGKFFLVRRHDLDKTHEFFAKNGKWVVLIGRFVPVIRHIVSIPAGIARMPLKTFFLQTFIGSTIWGSFLIILGYQLGDNWEAVAKKFKQVDLVIGVVVVLALLGLGAWFVMRRRRDRANNPE